MNLIKTGSILDTCKQIENTTPPIELVGVDHVFEKCTSIGQELYKRLAREVGHAEAADVSVNFMEILTDVGATSQYTDGAFVKLGIGYSVSHGLLSQAVEDFEVQPPQQVKRIRI